MAVDQVCWTSSDIVKTPVEIARWTMSFSFTAQTSSTGRPILCTYKPAVDSNEKSQKYYALIASHADDFLGRNVCQSTKNICVRGECEVFLQVFVPNNRVLRGRGALLFGCIVSFFVHNLSASLPTKGSPMSHREGFIQKIAVTFWRLFKDHIRVSRTTYQECKSQICAKMYIPSPS